MTASNHLLKCGRSIAQVQLSCRREFGKTPLFTNGYQKWSYKKLMTTGSVVDVKWPDITVGEQREHNCYAREGTNFLCRDNG